MSDGALKHNFAKAGVIMVASLFLSRVLGFVRDMVFTAKFGQGSLTDAYNASFQIPDILFYLIAGGALSSAFIPVFSEYLHSDREHEAWHVFSVVVCVMSSVVLAFIAISWVFTEPFLSVVAPGLPADMIPLAVQMSRIIVPAQFAFFIGGIMLGTMYARNVFTVPGLAPNIYNIGIIFGALVVSGFVFPSISGLSWGGLVGAFVGNIFIPIFVMRRMGVQFKISFDIKHEGVRKVFRLMLPVVLGLSLPGVFGLILKAYGTLFTSGVMSAIDLSNRLMQAPLGIFGQALALAAFPVLAQFRTQNRMDLFSNQLSKTLNTVLFLSIPVAVLFVVVPHPLIHALYVRGEFTMENANLVANSLQIFGIGVAAWCLQPTLMRAYYSVQKTWPPVIMGTITTVIFASGSYLLVQAGYGYLALPFAASVSAIFLAIMLVSSVNRTVCKIDIPALLLTVGKSTVASVPGALLLWLCLVPLAKQIGLTSGFGFLAYLLFVMCCYGWCYYFIAKMLGMSETDMIKRAMNRNKTESSQ